MDWIDLQTERALDGLVAIAMSNFPAPANVTISTNGANTGSIRMTAYDLKRILDLAREAHSR